jgi:SAM-dependent methyltransferase
MTYSTEFFTDQMTASRESADLIAGICQDLLHPGSVVDIGCGVGTWLAAFKAIGVADIAGYDGDWVDRQLLQISAEAFHTADLNQRLSIDRRYDLALSLETAEHLQPQRSETLVADLVALAPAVLFSAAIPHQGGTGHINERWQDYWAGLFAAHGYEVKDCIRPRIWNNAGSAFWYAQNTLLYVNESVSLDCPEGWPLRLVHPELHQRRATPGMLTLREVGRHIIPSARVSGRRQLGRLARIFRLRSRPG